VPLGLFQGFFDPWKHIKFSWGLLFISYNYDNAQVITTIEV
jgi:hypothetical protein